VPAGLLSPREELNVHQLTLPLQDTLFFGLKINCLDRTGRS
jgi:hypothetical protein